MILYQMIHLSKELEGHKEELYTLAAERGYSDPEVVKMGEKLDRLQTRYRHMFSMLPVYSHDLIKNQDKEELHYI